MAGPIGMTTALSGAVLKKMFPDVFEAFAVAEIVGLGQRQSRVSDIVRSDTSAKQPALVVEIQNLTKAVERNNRITGDILVVQSVQNQILEAILSKDSSRGGGLTWEDIAKFIGSIFSGKAKDVRRAFERLGKKSIENEKAIEATEAEEREAPKIEERIESKIAEGEEKEIPREAPKSKPTPKLGSTALDSLEYAKAILGLSRFGIIAGAVMGSYEIYEHPKRFLSSLNPLNLFDHGQSYEKRAREEWKENHPGVPFPTDVGNGIFQKHGILARMFGYSSDEPVSPLEGLSGRNLSSLTLDAHDISFKTRDISVKASEITVNGISLSGQSIGSIVVRPKAQVTEPMSDPWSTMTPSRRTGPVPVSPSAGPSSTTPGSGASAAVTLSGTQIPLQNTPSSIDLGANPTEAKLAAAIKKNFSNLSSSQCVALAKAVVGSTLSVKDWRRGENVISSGKLKPGTPIATFQDRHGNQSEYYDGHQGVGAPGNGTTHAAVFSGYIRDKSGKIVGFRAWEQYSKNGQRVPPHLTSYYVNSEFGEKNASNYEAVNGPDGHPLGYRKPVVAGADPNQSDRPTHIGGALTAFGKKFTFGSGALRGESDQSIPYGNYTVGGPVGPWGTAHGAIGIQNGRIWDPKEKRYRTGIELHGWNAETQDRLLSEGCMAIAGSQWRELRDAIKTRLARGEKLYLHVTPNGASIDTNPVIEPKLQTVVRKHAPREEPEEPAHPGNYDRNGAIVDHHRHERREVDHQHRDDREVDRHRRPDSTKILKTIHEGTTGYPAGLGSGIAA